MINKQVSNKEEILYNISLNYNVQNKYKVKANIEYFLLAKQPISEFITILVKEYLKYKLKGIRKISVFNTNGENRYSISSLRPYMV